MRRSATGADGQARERAPGNAAKSRRGFFNGLPKRKPCHILYPKRDNSPRMTKDYLVRCFFSAHNRCVWSEKMQLKFLIQVAVINTGLLFFYAFPLIFVIAMLSSLWQTETVKVFYSINCQ